MEPSTATASDHAQLHSGEVLGLVDDDVPVRLFRPGDERLSFIEEGQIGTAPSLIARLFGRRPGRGTAASSGLRARSWPVRVAVCWQKAGAGPEAVTVGHVLSRRVLRAALDRTSASKTAWRVTSEVDLATWTAHANCHQLVA